MVCIIKLNKSDRKYSTLVACVIFHLRRVSQISNAVIKIQSLFNFMFDITKQDDQISNELTEPRRHTLLDARTKKKSFGSFVAAYFHYHIFHFSSIFLTILIKLIVLYASLRIFFP